MKKKRSVGVTIFGWIFIILGLGSLLISLKPGIEFINILWSEGMFFPDAKHIMLFLFSLIIFLIFYELIYIICGIGLLRLKPWARHIIIVLIISSIVGILSKGLLFGWSSLSLIEVSVQVIIVSFMLWFLMKKQIIRQFEEEGTRFRLKSGYGVVICLIIFIALLTPSFILGLKIYASLKHKTAFFTVKPQAIKLQETEDSLLLGKYRRIELFNASFLIPKNSIILTLYKLSDASSDWDCFMTDSSDNKKGVVTSLSNRSTYEIMSEALKMMKFKNTYDFELALHTNNWSPIFMVLRNLVLLPGENPKVAQFNSPRLKGFIKSAYTKSNQRWMYDCSFYSKDTQVSKNMTIIYYKERVFTTYDAFNVISSFRLLKEQEIEVDKYYKEGLQSLNTNDFIEAQFKLANAYYLSPENPEYGYMFAKVLAKNGKKSFRGAQRILEDVLELKPDYTEAKELLETIKSELASIDSPDH